MVCRVRDSIRCKDEINLSFTSFLGSGPNRGQSPVEWGDFPFVCPSVCPSPIQPGLRPSPPGLRPCQPGLRPGQPSLRHQAWLAGPDAWLDGPKRLYARQLQSLAGGQAQWCKFYSLFNLKTVIISTYRPTDRPTDRLTE